MANTFLHANNCEVAQHQAVKDRHPLVGWCKYIKGHLRRMCKRRIEILVEGFCHLYTKGDLLPSVRNISWYRISFGFMAEVTPEALWIDFKLMSYCL